MANPAQSQLMQRQYNAGLRLKQQEKTGNLYKHIYVNSAYRTNVADIPSNFEIFLQNEIVVPPDGNTRIKIHRANIPMTFNNIIRTIQFTIPAGSAGGITNQVQVNLPPGYYDPSKSEIYLNETFDFGILGRINRQIVEANNAALLRVATTTSNKLAFINKNDLSSLTVNNVSFGGADLNYTKRILGFPVDSPNVVSFAQSPNIYGPYFYSELFIRMSSIPINYDLIDARTAAPADIIAVVPINVDTFGQIISVGPYDSLVYNFAPNSRINRLKLQLTYSDGTLIDTQGQDWSCVLSIVKENPDDINPAQLRTPVM
jgi:hypothetical protein